VFYTCYLRGSRALLHARSLSHRHVRRVLRCVRAALAALAHGAAVAAPDAVGLAGLHVLLERFRLALQLVNRLLLLRHRRLHLVEHLHLLLFEPLDRRLGRRLLRLVLLLLLHVVVRGRLVVLVPVLTRLAVLLLPLRVHVARILQLLKVITLLLVLEHVVVAVEEVVQIVARVGVLVEHVVLVRVDVRDRLVAAARIVCVLARDTCGLRLGTPCLQVVVVGFALGDRIREVRVFVRDLDLALQTLVLVVQVAQAVLEQHLLRLLLLLHHLLLELT